MDKKTKNGIITIAVVAILGIAGYKLLKKPAASGGTSGGTSGGSTDGGGTGGGGVPSPSGIDAGQLANDLFDAFDGYGTKNQVVIDTFRLLRTDADFNALVSAYGTRKIPCGKFNPFCTDFEGGLIPALKNECSTGEIANINQILSDKGISKRI